MNRKIETKVKAFRTKDGAGVSLVRVLGHDNVKDFDPILMLDSFDSLNPEDYTAGFPIHPHRGIKTISNLAEGKMLHRDSLGNEDMIESGEVQWMTAGSGILHEEQLPASERMLGVQLWLNLPKKDKMTRPEYKSINKADIKEIEIEGGKLRLLAGTYKNHEGFKVKFQPLDYYALELHEGAEFHIEMDNDDRVILFTLLGSIEIEGDIAEEKTALKLTKGSKLTLKAKEEDNILFIKSRPLHEPIAWAGPIVTNSEEEIQEAFREIRNGSFIRDQADYNLL